MFVFYSYLHVLSFWMSSPSLGIGIKLPFCFYVTKTFWKRPNQLFKYRQKKFSIDFMISVHDSDAFITDLDCETKKSVGFSI